MGNIRSKNLDWVPEYSIPLLDPEGSLVTRMSKALLRQAHPQGDKVGGHSGSRPADTCEKAAKADKTLSF